VFENEKSIIAKRFHPDEDLVSEIEAHVAAQGGIDFFSSPGWEGKYSEIVSRLVPDGSFPGAYESDGEYEDRVRWELAESRSVIGAKLGKEVNFLCWPGGGVNAAAKRLALDSGYLSWTLPGGDSSGKRNVPGSDPTEVKRVPAMRDVHFFGREWGRGSDILMLLDVMVHQNSTTFRRMRDFYKVSVALGVAGEK
jgi:hypothetical protein